jgi:N utilization substance protein B
MVDLFLEDSRELPQTIETARTMATETLARGEEIDCVLARHARHWELGRLAMVDRNILRLATWELLARDVPYKVVITEALRLAQEFSTVESPRFINGVLDAISRELGRDTESGSSDAGDTRDDNGSDEHG